MVIVGTGPYSTGAASASPATPATKVTTAQLHRGATTAKFTTPPPDHKMVTAPPEINTIHHDQELLDDDADDDPKSGGDRHQRPPEPGRDEPHHSGMGAERIAHHVRACGPQSILKQTVRQQV